MASKPDLLSGETRQVAASSQLSVARGDVVIPKSTLSDNLKLNEESKEHGDISSCDFVSEKTRGKEMSSSSTTHGAPIDVEMLPKVSSRAIVEDQLTSNVDQRPIIERNKSSEDNGDNNLSVNVVNNSSIVCDQSYDKLVTAKPSLKHDSSGIFPGVDTDRTVGSDPNVKFKSGKDCGQSKDKILKCSDDDENVEKFKKLAEDVDTKDSLVHSASSDENEDSDIVEQDVKVCDICGDAGREDLLAICCRCSDGAEHTYCMRDMLQKVPEGDWLCEECRMAEETESQKQVIEGKRANKSYLGIRGSGKRPAEDVEVAPVSKKQAIEPEKGLLNFSSNKLGLLSRDKSFKHTDKGKVSLSCQASSLNHMSKITSDGGRPPSMGSKNNPSKGMLSKSSSFNTVSKPKVKPMDEVPHKQKGIGEHMLPDKEGRLRAIGKSMSFKSGNSNYPNSTESKATSLSSIPAVLDFKGLNSPKEHGSFKRKTYSKLDRSLSSTSKSSPSVSASKTEQKLTTRGETASLSSSSNNRGFKFVNSDEKLLASKSTRRVACKGSETATTPVGVSSTSGFSAPFEKKLNNNSQDEPSSSSSLNSDRALNHGDGLPRSRESSQVDKCRDNKRGRSKHGGASLRTIACQRCKDVGHDAESCSLRSPHACGVDSSTARGSGEELNEGNKLKAAITAAMLKKPGIYRRRQLEKSSELATSNVEMRSAAPSLDHPSPHNIISTDIQETKNVGQGCSSDSHKAENTNNAKQLAGQAAETLSSKMTYSNSVICSNGNPVLRDMDMHTSAVPLIHLKMPVIPKQEYIWQGAFQVCKGGKLPELCDGMQAHLSTFASPKVVEAVDKFPQSILFDEVPRLSTWPSHFNASGAREDHIALYFFAKDSESYERNYKHLLENMIKNDLTLKGEINGVELLIFPSNWLLETSQRWNMLYFLWGVFRGRRVIGMDPNLEELQTPSVNVVHMDKKIPGAVLSFSESVSSLKSKDEGLLSGTAADSVFARESNISAQSPRTVASSINKKNRSFEAILRQKNSMSGTGSVQSCSEIDCTKNATTEIGFQECEQDAQFQQSVEPPGTSNSNRMEEMVHQNVQDVKHSLCHSAKIFPVDSGEIGAGRSDAEDKILDFKEDRDSIPKDALEIDLNLKESSHQQNKRKHFHTVLEDAEDKIFPVDSGENDAGRIDAEDKILDFKEDRDSIPKDALEIDLNLKESSHHQQNKRKHFHTGLKEAILRTSGGTKETIQRNDDNDSVFEGQSPGKKLKSDISGRSACNSFGVGSSVCDKVSTSSTENRLGKVCEVKWATKDFGTAERYFFPLDSASGNGLHLENDSMQRKAHEPENEIFLGGVPNLELALGADTNAPNNGIQPLISGVPDHRHKDSPQDEMLLKEEEEDVSASLSLSLSFPFPDREQAVEPVKKAERTLPEKHHVNTSLLLFGVPQQK